MTTKATKKDLKSLIDLLPDSELQAARDASWSTCGIPVTPS